MPPKRYGKFRGYHAYIRLSDYQIAICPIPRPPSLEKEERQLKRKISTAFYCDLESYLFVQYFITIA
jgi:hypothetical protein